MTDTPVYVLSDSVISRIVRIVQNGLLTETDVTPDLRHMRVVTSELKPNELIDVEEGSSFSDAVLLRVVQAVQESFMTGTDFTDHMHMMRLTDDLENEGSMTLTDDYVNMVKRNLEIQVEEGKRLSSERKRVEEEGYEEDESHILRGEE